MRRTRGVISRKLVLQIEPIAELEDGTLIYPIMGSEDDPQEEGEGDEEEEDESDEDEDDSEEKPKPKRRSKTKETPDQMKRRLNREAREHREAREAAEAQLREIQDKDKSELEIIKRDFAELQKKYDKVPETLDNLRIENALLRLDRKKYDWHDPADALERILKDPDVSVADDGTVEGLEEAVKELARTKPYLLRKKSEEEEEQGGGRRTPRTPRGASGAPMGTPKGGTKAEQAALQEQKLKDKYKITW